MTLEAAAGLGMTGSGYVWLVDRDTVAGGPEGMASQSPQLRAGLTGALLFGFRQDDEPNPVLATGLAGVSASDVNPLLVQAGAARNATGEEVRADCGTYCRTTFDAVWSFGLAWTKLLAADRWDRPCRIQCEHSFLSPRTPLPLWVSGPQNARCCGSQVARPLAAIPRRACGTEGTMLSSGPRVCAQVELSDGIATRGRDAHPVI